MAVITVSRQFGSHAEIIARTLSERLGYEYVDKELLAEVGQLANASPSDLEPYDERGERGIRAFLSKSFLGSVAYDYTMYYPFVWGADPPSFYRSSSAPNSAPLTQRELIRCFKTVFDRLWQRGNVVIMGRGSQVVLKQKPHTFHLRLVASFEERCQRVMQEYSLSESDAQERVEEADKQRAQYLKRYYHADWSDPSLYHLIVNTGLASREAVLGSVLALVEAME